MTEGVHIIRYALDWVRYFDPPQGLDICFQRFEERIDWIEFIYNLINVIGQFLRHEVWDGIRWHDGA